MIDESERESRSYNEGIAQKERWWRGRGLHETLPFGGKQEFTLRQVVNGEERGAVLWDLYIYRANKGLNGQNGEKLWGGSRRFAYEGKKCARGGVKAV